jgi:tetratricopeptide (TPR) repeat protein
MKVSIKSAWQKRLVLGAGILLCVAYLAVVGQLFLASWFGNRVTLSSLQRAARLDWDDADYHDHVGRYYALVARDPASAIASFRTAVQLNPHAARFWFDLSSAYEVLGNIPEQSKALEGAITADPTTPDVAWEAANFYAAQGQDDKALREFRVVLANDPSLANLAMQMCWRIKPDPDVLLAEVVPANAQAYVAFLELLMTKQETAATVPVWDALIATGQSFEERFLFEYFQYLILHKDVDDAYRTWREGARLFHHTSYIPMAHNLIVNGDFGLDILNAGFDWRYEKQPSVTLTLDPTDSHGGHRSLLVTFDGPGVNDAGIYQFIPVQSGTTYDFSAYYKDGDLEGAGGPHFTIQDFYTGAVLYDSDELRDAGFWKSATGELTTGADTRLLLLHIRRLPEGSAIRGKLWVDDFRLVKKEAKEE